MIFSRIVKVVHVNLLNQRHFYVIMISNHVIMLSCFLFVCFAPLSGNKQGWSYSFVTKRFVWVGVVEKTWLLALRNDWMVTKRNRFHYKETTSIMINGFHNANWLPLASTKKNGARSSHQRCSMKNVVLRNFTKFTKQ